MKKTLLLLLSFLFLAVGGLKAQFQTGVYSSNFSGVMGPLINPASTTWLSNSTEVLPIGFNFSVLNNGFYLPARSFPGLIGNSATEFLSDTGKNVSEKFDRVFQIKRDLKPSNYAYIEAIIYGPSVHSNFGKFSAGIHTASRNFSSSYGLTPELATFLLKGNRTNDLIGKTMSMENSRSGNLVLADIAANFSFIMSESQRFAHRFGLTAHYLLGVNSVYWWDGSSKWTFGSDSSIYVENGQFNYGYAATRSKFVSELLKPRGSGFAFDLGYTITRKKRTIRSTYAVCPNIQGGGRIRKFQTYKWRLGVSLMDIGFVNFRQQTVATQYNSINAPVDSLIDAAYGGVFALDRRLRFAFIGSPGASFNSETEYRHFMPTRLNVQFDYYWRDQWFFSFFGTQRVVLDDIISTRAPNILSVAIRHENPKTEWSVPISLIEYQYPVVGFHYRYGPFFIGSNQILEFMGLRKIRGLDMYLGLKFNISHIKGY